MRHSGSPTAFQKLATCWSLVCGTLGKVYVITGDDEFYFKDGNIIWFKPVEAFRREFLRQLYLTPAVMKQITDASAGTTVGTYTISGASEDRNSRSHLSPNKPPSPLCSRTWTRS